MQHRLIKETMWVYFWLSFKANMILNWVSKTFISLCSIDKVCLKARAACPIKKKKKKKRTLVFYYRTLLQTKTSAKMPQLKSHTGCEILGQHRPVLTVAYCICSSFFLPRMEQMFIGDYY